MTIASVAPRAAYLISPKYRPRSLASRLLLLVTMNDWQSSNHDGEQLPCRQQIVAIFLRSAKRKLVSLELRANHLRTSAIRKAAHLAAGADVGLEQCIIDACFRRQLHYDSADEYADNIAKVIAEITQ